MSIRSLVGEGARLIEVRRGGMLMGALGLYVAAAEDTEYSGYSMVGEGREVASRIVGLCTAAVLLLFSRM